MISVRITPMQLTRDVAQINLCRFIVQTGREGELLHPSFVFSLAGKRTRSCQHMLPPPPVSLSSPQSLWLSWQRNSLLFALVAITLRDAVSGESTSLVNIATIAEVFLLETAQGL